MPIMKLTLTLSDDLCKFIHNGNSKYTSLKSRSNHEKYNMLFHNFTMWVKKDH